MGVWEFCSNVGRDFEPYSTNRSHHDGFTRAHTLRARRAPQLSLESYLANGAAVGLGEAPLTDHCFRPRYRSPLSPPQPYRDLDHLEHEQCSDGCDPPPSVEEDDCEDDSYGCHDKPISGHDRADGEPGGNQRCELFR